MKSFRLWMSLSVVMVGFLSCSSGQRGMNTTDVRTESEITPQPALFDYIVVGTGPAGSVIANRLSADGRNKVLVLEAGGNNDNDSLIINATADLYNYFPMYFWPGETVAQEGIGGRPLNIGHGRTSGGGSSINGEIYVRPTTFVLERWVQAADNKWSPVNAMRHFRNMENFNGSRAQEDVHGYDGELHIRQNFQQPPVLVEKLVVAMEKGTGYQRVDDYNDPRTPIGPFAHHSLYHQPDGRRASASVCFLGEDVLQRENLVVVNQATVSKVLFSGDNTAQGVEFIHNGITTRAFAAKKVILSAGINSVQILMLSGIGPRDVLEEYGIPVVYENENVGKGLITDSYCNAMFKVSEQDAEAMHNSDPNAKWPAGAFLPDPRGQWNSMERCVQILPSYLGDGTLRLGILNVNSKSRGYSRIQSADPLKMLLVDHKALSHPDDLELMKTIYRTYVLRIADELEKIDSTYILVAPTREEIADDEKLTEHIKSTFSPSFHDQGQLRMGRESEGAVVNSSGEVYGVRNLVVADASIIPYSMDGNTSGPAYLIGSVIAEEILSE